MQWQVHGKDANTGRDVTLAVDHPQALGAIKAAISKRILVSYVTGPFQLRMRSLVLSLACAVALACIAAAVTLHWQNAAQSAQLNAAQSQNHELSTSLASSSQSLRVATDRIASLEQANSGNARDLIDQLADSQKKLAGTEKDLLAAQSRLADLEHTANATTTVAQAEAADTKKKLAAAQSQVASFQKQLQQQKHDLDLQTRAAAKLTKSNNDLAAQLDVLKSQLLVNVAKTDIPAPATPVAETPVAHPARWALIIAYDNASDFLSLHFPRDGTTTLPAAEETFATTAMLPSSAATLRIVHDADKQKVYSASLTLPLAGDTPKEKIAENLSLLADFSRAFAPGFTTPDTWLANAAKQLAGKDPSDRIVKIGDDFKLTLSTTKSGLYTCKIESPRADLE